MARSATTSTSPTLASGSRVIVVVSKGPAPTPPSAFMNVPDVQGQKQGDALAAMQAIGSTAQVFNDYSATHKRGTVMGQLPWAGTSVPSGTEAILLVSSGPSTTETADVMLPDVVGKPEDAALATLRDAGFAPRLFTSTAPPLPPIRSWRSCPIGLALSPPRPRAALDLGSHSSSCRVGRTHRILPAPTT